MVGLKEGMKGGKGMERKNGGEKNNRKDGEGYGYEKKSKKRQRRRDEGHGGRQATFRMFIDTGWMEGTSSVK